MNNRTFYRFALAVTSPLTLLPLIFLISYQRRFGFDPMIVVFGQGLILFTATLFGLAVVGVSLIRARAGRPLPAWPFGIAAGAMAAAVAFIFAGARMSNTAWGDTLNYQLVLTFGANLGGVLDFLPATTVQKTTLLTILLAGTALLLLMVFIVAGSAAWLLSARADRWLRTRHGRSTRAAGVLAAVCVAAAGTCIAIAIATPRSLHGEPLSGFFKLFPASKLHQLDNVRLAAAVEDRASHAAYPKPATFRRRNVVLIMVDSLRADHMGLYGYHRDTTPFLSELHRKRQLHRVEMALSTCSESYCGIASTLGSRPLHQLSVHNFKLHTLLRDQGYRLNFFLGGDHRGWNYLFDYYGPDIDALYDVVSLKGTTDKSAINDDRLLLEALEKIEVAGEQPNFFNFFLMSTHSFGLKLPQYERYRPVATEAMRVMSFWGQIAHKMDTGAEHEARAELDALVNRYDNGVLQADANLARIFETLRRKGYLRDSIVVIVGDHGEALGEKGHIGHTRFLYQEDIRIPMLVYDDEAARQGTSGPYQNDAFGTLVDVAPDDRGSFGIAGSVRLAGPFAATAANGSRDAAPDAAREIALRRRR